MPGPLFKLVTPLIVALAVCAGVAAPTRAQQTAAPAVKSKEKGKEKARVKAEPTSSKAARLDLNRATAEEMQEALPGVGEVTAGKIVAGRPYQSVDDLAKAGVPARTIEQIRPLVIVGRPPQPVTVKGVRPATKGQTPGSAPTEPITPVDLNTATLAQLETLPGVGPTHAREIIAARPFRSVNDLSRVKGLGQARIDALREHVTLSSATPAAVSPTPTTTTTTPATTPASESPVMTRTKAAPRTKAATATTPAVKSATRPATGRAVNLNTATREELDALPGIGPVKAEAILEYRKATPFRTPEDVMKVKGIKEGEFARIRDLISVQ